MGLRTWGLPVLLPALPMVLLVPTTTCLYLNPSALVGPALKVWVSGLGAYLCYYLHYLRCYLYLLLLVCT